MSKEISPLPWENGTGHITDASGDGIVQCFRALRGDKEANAAFIVKACNSHDQLVEAVKAFVKYDAGDHNDGVTMMLDYEDARTKCIAALAAAGAQ